MTNPFQFGEFREIGALSETYVGAICEYKSPIYRNIYFILNIHLI